MCQLNLYIVPKQTSREVMLELLKKHFIFERPECVSDENLLEEVKSDYDVYVSAPMGCNCGTIQSRFQDAEITTSWKGLKESMIKKGRERLEEIKSVIEREDYEAHRKFVYDKIEELNEKRNKAKGKDLEKVLKETQVFIQENRIVFDCMKYDKSIDENGNEVVFNFVDEDIKNIEKAVCENTDEDFLTLKNFVDDVLKHTSEIKLFSYWQDGDLPVVESEEYIFQGELKIEDIIFLKYKSLLTIYKR